MNNVSLKPEHWDEDFHVAAEPFLYNLYHATSSAASNLGFSLNDNDFTLTPVMGSSANRLKTSNMTRRRADFAEHRRCIRAAAKRLRKLQRRTTSKLNAIS